MARRKAISRKSHRPHHSSKTKVLRPDTYKTGKITTSPFLNFVRDVRKNSKGLSICEIGSKAGKIWRNMTDEQKKPYYLLAKKAKLQNPHGHGMRGRPHKVEKRHNSSRSKRRSF
ncbi:unnamed protein product [Acanthoscelides obtectus]|uniref:HMG box domain-containing protein n=1 Tax=Acanthoscelides obtectus TaxID=200917 RepID=A0A9P0JMU3_ACAOB|nr:unnamed protein product [Acanthoscelides obtectus]CAK1672893.1 hypothetical protein AOBTE_LOCUS29133 [Acanthoscelides obtectus]